MKYFFKNTFIYSIGNILPKAASFLLLPIYTKYLSTEDYGIVSCMLALQPILTIIFSLALDSSIFRLYHDCKGKDVKQTFLSTIFYSSVFLSIFNIVLLFTFQSYIEMIYSNIDFFPYYSTIILYVSISNLFNLPKKYLMLNEKASLFVVLSILQFCITAALILWFLIKLNSGAYGYLKGYLISSALFLPIYLAITFKFISFKFSFNILKQIAAFSFPLIPTLLSAWVLDLSDRIFIERYFTLSDVGIYSLSYKIASIILIVSLSIDKAYRPLFFKLAKDEKTGTIYTYNNTIFILITFLCFIISLFSKEIIVLFFSSNYYNAYKYIPLIAFSYIFSVLGGLVARNFEQSKKTTNNMYIYLVSLVINILLNFALIPRFGVYGAAFATIISMFFVFITGYLYSKRKCFFVPFNWFRIFPLMFIMLITILAFNYFSIDNIYKSLIVKILVTAGFSLYFLKRNYSYVKDILK